MICLSDTRSGVSIATIVFYTCIWIPFKQMKLQILDIFSFIHHHRFCQPRKGSDDDVHEPTGLPAARFEEVASCSRDGGNGGGGCSICLAEYQREDMGANLGSMWKCSYAERMPKDQERESRSCRQFHKRQDTVVKERTTALETIGRGIEGQREVHFNTITN
ncbi:hypothetical protein M9H77_24523 [Catharanthus roseus]|uniref:Uncharacterized protein n=1 Tax=Catharanthus roseus TaxID=4058 RepID=A0ACC0AWF9_CATRO|nr:hypothetical protein M9H77_24523 [Catharanthus roseus]